MKRLTIAIVMMILPVLALADDGPKTPAVRGVMTKLDKAKADAKTVYDRSVARAVDDATRELDKLKSDVMKRGDLDEANRIAKAAEGVGEAVGAPALRVMLLVKGHAEVYIGSTKLGEADSGEMLIATVPIGSSGDLTIKAKSEFVYRSMRAALVDDKGNVVKGVRGADAGWAERDPDPGFSDGWNKQLKNDTSKWILIPEKNQVATFKIRI